MAKRNRHSLLRSARGAAALEAAVILPFFIFFIIGTFELYQQYRAQSQVDLVATNIAQSVALQPALFEGNDCQAGNVVCVYEAVAADLYRPFGFDANGRVVISVWYAAPGGAGGAGWVRDNAADGWSVSYPSSSSVSHTNLGSTAGFPPARAGDSIIVVETLYRHTPFVLSGGFWKLVTGESTLYSRAVARPLNGDLRALQPTDE